MLPIALVAEICQLLDEGELTQRAIALKLGVSRGTVIALANGRRGLFGRQRRTTPATPLQMRPAAERCPGCGGLVYPPCRLCAVRAYRRRRDRIRRLQGEWPEGPRRGPRRAA